MELEVRFLALFRAVGDAVHCAHVIAGSEEELVSNDSVHNCQTWGHLVMGPVGRKYRLWLGSCWARMMTRPLCVGRKAWPGLSGWYG
jgi:hypothetical protein